MLEWAGIRPALLPPLGIKRVNQRDVPCHDADVWIHPNTPGTWEHAPGGRPYRLEVEQGIAVGPSDREQPAFPRVPLLGVAALGENRLDFWFDSKAAHCHLWTADWRSKLMRLLAWR